MNRARASADRPDQPPEEIVARACRALGLSPVEHVKLGVRRAMARAAVEGSLEYARLLDSDPSEEAALITELTVGETYFLRESGQFEFVQREVLPRLAARMGRPITAWSAGCASGEEAYSLAMTAQEADPPCRIRVLGTDVADSRLAAARRAVYGEWSLRGVSEPIVKKYFHRTHRHVTVAPAIRSMVEFRSLNLADAEMSGSSVFPVGMDLVFCRNVLIYLDTATVARVVRKLIASLSADGWLFLGASDPSITDIVRCDVVVTGSGLAYRRPGRSHRASTPPGRLAETQLPARAIAPLPELENMRPSPAAAPIKCRNASVSLCAGARQAYGLGDYPRSIELARECVTQDDRDAESWILLVRGLANLGLNDEAGLACAAGLDLHRTSTELTYMHAMLLRQSARNAEALAALRCALYLDRQFVVAHLAVGDVLSAMGDRSAARNAFRNAERLLLASSEREVIPGSDGLDAGRLLAVAQMQLGILDDRYGR